MKLKLTLPIRLKISFLVSMGVHGIILLLLVGSFALKPKLWGGGLTGKGMVVTVDLITEFVGAPFMAPTGAINRAPTSPRKTTASSGTGNSPTPAGGSGSGYESAPADESAANTLSLIRQKILAAKLYPLQAARRGIEGSVELLFYLKSDGSVQEVKVIRSSGASLLDEEALNTIRRAAPYPYYEGDIKLAINFDLDE